jgi:hypothetical protein
VQITTDNPVCVEVNQAGCAKDFGWLLLVLFSLIVFTARITLRAGGHTIASGIITQIDTVSNATITSPTTS